MRIDDVAYQLQQYLAIWGARLEIEHKSHDILWVSTPTGPDVGIYFSITDSPNGLITVNEFTFDDVPLNLVPTFLAAIFEKRARISVRGRLVKWIHLVVPAESETFETARRLKGHLDPWQVELLTA